MTTSMNDFRLPPAPIGAAAETGRSRVYRVAPGDKTALLTALLRRSEMRSVLVFVRRRVDADRLARAVTRSGVNAASLHSEHSQEERTAALAAFRCKACPVLVATDTVEPRLDVRGISQVINFDVPRCRADYLHRAGRTGRVAAAGQVITFVAPDEERSLAQIESELGALVPHTERSHGNVPAWRAPQRTIGRRRRRRPHRRPMRHDHRAPAPAEVRRSTATDRAST